MEEVDISTFDPRDPRMSVDPYPVYRALRERAPMHWVEATKMWVATSYADIAEILTDDETYKHRYEHREISRYGEGVREQPYFNAIRRMVFMMDGADHARIRPYFAKWFLSPVRARALQPIVERVASSLMDELQDRPSFDVVTDYAYQIPLRVIGELLTVPDEDHARIAHSVEAIVPLAEGSVPKSGEFLERGNAALTLLYDYFRDLARKRRANPGDDLLSAMIAAADEGGFLDEDEFIANIILVYFAGHDTTTASTSLSILALHRHPDQLAKLKADPSLIGKTVEELFRFEPPGQGVGRIPVRDVVVGGKKVEEGSVILCYLAAGNRDPAVFDDPDRLNIERQGHKILSFAAGVHTCLGNLLARQELRIGLATLLARRPNLQLETIDPPPSAFKPSAVSRGLRTLRAHG
ncbi:MAG: cytochrome P450 [Hyphomonadaceae bacterium]